MKYDIFISYKRKGTSSATAAYLYELLLQKGYNVFFDRKEMRSGKFNEQLLEHISNATDIIILLEEESLGAWFNNRSSQKDSYGMKGTANSLEMGFDLQEEAPYKTDWFCREVMHALSLEGKNIIPLLLNGYRMPEGKDLPPEMAELSLHNALSLEISEVEEFYEKYFVEQEYLKSKPANLSLTKRFQSKGGIVGCFLFYTDVESCDLLECGERVATLTDDNDEWHPFRYPVNFAGEHRFQAVNNDSCESITIRCSVDTNCQQYVSVQFSEIRDLWKLTKEEIEAQEDARLLYDWGLGLFDGTSKHEPDIALSLVCLERAIFLGNKDAVDFVCSHGSGLITQKHVPAELAVKWYMIAAEHGNTDAQANLGVAFLKGIGVDRSFPKAFDWYKKAAEQGNARAQRGLGSCYFNGEGVEQDYGKAFEWSMKAAEQGDAQTQSYVGYFYFEGLGVEQDYGKAFDWFMKAAEQGDAQAQLFLGVMCYNGNGVEQDYCEAYKWYKKAAEQGDAQAQRFLGVMYENGNGVEQDYGEAYKWYAKAAEQGNKIAELSLGMMYFGGKGVNQDYEKGIELLTKSAKQGHLVAQRMLGIMFYSGEEVEQDYGEAYKWCLKSAEKGDEVAQRYIGLMYELGRGIEQDFSKSFGWYMKAAVQGDAQAQCNLGYCYYRGQGVEQDYGKAFDWFTKAAEQGNERAQSNLGICYLRGLGVEQDYGKAIEWFTKAAEQGNASVYNSVAWTYYLIGDYEKAFPWAEKAVKEFPDNPDVLDTLATVYENLGRYDEALTLFERCLHLYAGRKNDKGEKRTVEKIEVLKGKMQANAK